MKKLITLTTLLISITSFAAEVCVIDLYFQHAIGKKQGAIYNHMKCTGNKPLQMELYSVDTTLENRQLVVIREFEQVGYQLRTKNMYDLIDGEYLHFELVFVKN